MESTIPASTGVNHQNKVRSSCHMNTPQINPTSVCHQCRATAEPGHTVRHAFLRTPAHADAEQVGDDEKGVPEHQERRVQRRENGFADNAQRGARQTAERAAALPVKRKVNERERLRQT